MFTVVGAGFGTYAYFPALVEAFREPVILPRAYEAVVDARAELAPYRDWIRWASDVEAALDEATDAVIAVRPASQPELVSRCCARAGLGRIVIEKPVAPSPGEARQVLAELRRHGKRFRVGYTLLHTAWGRGLEWPRSASVTVDWRFMAHHFAHGLRNWKREHESGGGALRFFGVHLVALLARAGYDHAMDSTLGGQAPGEPERWEASFSGPGLPDCRVRLDSRAAEPGFAIAGDAPVIAMRDPFDPPVAGATLDDRRVPVLADLLASFGAGDAAFVDLYERTNALWAEVERISRTVGP